MLKQLIEKYKQLLQLQWDLVLQFGGVDLPTIMSDVDTKKHLVTMPEVHEQLWMEYRCDFVNMLIRASWAEKIDSIFSVVRLDTKKDYSKPGESRGAQNLNLAQYVLEVWSSDQMFNLDPVLVKEDSETWLSLVESHPDAFLLQQGMIMFCGLALISANVNRHELIEYRGRIKIVEERLKKLIPQNEYKILRKLTQFYSQLPPLPIVKSEAIKLYSDKTAEAANILNLKIQPKLVKAKDGLWFWTF